MEIPSGDGVIAVSNRLQGRIFCAIDGMLIHRFDSALAEAPSHDKFNNIGGNSLWPGPEGGDYAFNYLPGPEWLVQPAINSKESVSISLPDYGATIGKDLPLRNRKGMEIELHFRRHVQSLDTSRIASDYSLRTLGYRTLDMLHPKNSYPTEKMLFCAWSLEQFPGGDQVMAFGRMRGDAADGINTKYYGDPGKRLESERNCFRLRLGGEERFQIGISHEAGPELIGAYDRERSLLIIRKTWPQEGLYFNIADNEQPGGPFSAADSFSIFNGGNLGFYELETIAPLQLGPGNTCGPSLLWSETIIMQGTRNKLVSCFEKHFKMPGSFLA